MLKTIAAMAAAALVAAAITVLHGPDTVAARTTVPLAKGDRLALRPVGTACSQQAWPYFETGCLRDRARSGGRARTIPIVATDRLAPAEESPIGFEQSWALALLILSENPPAPFEPGRREPGDPPKPFAKADRSPFFGIMRF
jgi:hypothetical protein